MMRSAEEAHPVECPATTALTGWPSKARAKITLALAVQTAALSLQVTKALMGHLRAKRINSKS